MALSQDVMLSGPSAQSPISSVLTMPTVSMSTQSSMTSSAFSDSLLLNALPGMTTDASCNTAAAADFMKTEFNPSFGASYKRINSTPF